MAYLIVLNDCITDKIISLEPSWWKVGTISIKSEYGMANYEHEHWKLLNKLRSSNRFRMLLNNERHWTLRVRSTNKDQRDAFPNEDYVLNCSMLNWEKKLKDIVIFVSINADDWTVVVTKFPWSILV